MWAAGSIRRLWTGVASLLVATWGCGGGGAASSQSSPKGLFDGQQGPDADSGRTAPEDRASRIALAHQRPASLAFSIEPVFMSHDDLLFVSDHADRAELSVVRRDHQTGNYDPPVIIPGEHFYRAFAGADELTLVTTRGDDICARIIPYGSDTGKGSCARVHADGVVQVDDRLAIIQTAVVGQDDVDARPVTLGKRRPAPPSEPERKAKPDDRPAEHEVGIRWMSRSGTLDASGRQWSGLRFHPPLAGMNFIDAIPRAGGIDVLFYETAKPSRSEKDPSPLGRAAISAAHLGADLQLDQALRHIVVRGELDYGTIRDHREPQLLPSPQGSIYLGLQWQNGRCEARRALPGLGPSSQDSVYCAIHPELLSEQKHPNPEDRVALQHLMDRNPFRAYGQPQHEARRVVWSGDRAFFQADGKLWSRDRSGLDERLEPAPFVANRAAATSACVSEDASFAIQMVDGLILGDPSGATRLVSASPPLASPGMASRRMARIGKSWWMVDEDVRSVSDGQTATTQLPPIAALHPDYVSLVGDADAHAWLIKLDHGRISRAKLRDGVLGDANASALNRIADFVALPDAAGGATIITVDLAGVVAATQLSSGGEWSSPAALYTNDSEDELQLPVPFTLPGGIALIDAKQHITWLNRRGEAVATADIPSTSPPAICEDGQSLSRWLPSPTPGALLEVHEIEGACLLSVPRWTSDGALTWIALRRTQLDSALERASISASKLGVEWPPTWALADASTTTPPTSAPPKSDVTRSAGCPPEMVNVAGAFCIDRFEGRLSDQNSGNLLSPDYASTPNLQAIAMGRWATHRQHLGTVVARAFPLPFIDPGQVGVEIVQTVAVRAREVPSGYVTGLVASAACEASGKRLCSQAEFSRACRGETNTLYPYGPKYETGTCNVHRPDHPAVLLHGHASVGHLDPRLNRITVRGETLLRRTGTTSGCLSRWGDDAIYDMVGNLDEWVAKNGFPKKASGFAGGFYSRATKSGCEALVESHPANYLDYSTGVRCCRDN